VSETVPTEGEIDQETFSVEPARRAVNFSPVSPAW
jgi:hypothetical protein